MTAAQPRGEGGERPDLQDTRAPEDPGPAVIQCAPGAVGPASRERGAVARLSLAQGGAVATGEAVAETSATAAAGLEASPGQDAAPVFADLWDEPVAGASPAAVDVVGTGDALEVGLLLHACVAELHRLAADIAAVDAAVAAALVAPCMPHAPPGQTRHSDGGERPTASPAVLSALQSVDLLRQESAGVAQVLRLVAEHGHCAGRVPAALFASATPLAAQRLRLRETSGSRPAPGGSE